MPADQPADRRRQKVVDCLFHNAGEATDFSSVQEAHTPILDQVVEMDEDLMEKYLGGEELAPEQLHDPFEKAMREGHLVPICFVSAKTGVGIPELLDAIARHIPTPAEGNPPPFLTGEGDAAERVASWPRIPAATRRARVQGDDGPVRRQARACSASTRARSAPARSCSSATAGSPCKLAHLFRMQGKEHTEVPQAVPATSARSRRSRRCTSTTCCTIRTTRTTST